MDLIWHGHACFRLRGRTAAALTDPYPPSLGPRLGKLEADLVTVSHGDVNHSHVEAVAGDPFVISGPGEYEIKGVHVTGLPSYHDSVEGAEQGRNTVYLVEIDDVRICHLGDLGHRPSDAMVEDLGTVDVLLVPVAGSRVIQPAVAAEIVRQVEPRVVIPMHFDFAGLRTPLGGVDTFLKEMGVPEIEPLAKLTIQSTSGEVEATKVVVLEARTSG